jgi:hypothetical protein
LQGENESATLRLVIAHRQVHRQLARDGLVYPSERVGVVMGNSRAKSISSSGPAKQVTGLAISMSRHLSKLREVDAVFTWADDGNVIHVYSVVHDFQSRTYKKLLQKERLVERDFPEISFEFHVRAHQGRNPEHAVPVGSESVFVNDQRTNRTTLAPRK